MTSTGAGIEFQTRDYLLLRDLFASRVMTLSHIASLHFEGRGEAAKKRVQKLKVARLIGERPRKARDPAIHFLTAAGYRLLLESGQLTDFPRLSERAFEKRARVSELTLRHELQVMDVKAALVPAIARTPGMTVVEFLTWPLLCQFDARLRNHAETTVKPDGYVRVEELAKDGAVYEHAFFLEVDRGTETLNTLTFRAQCYREHYVNGGYAASRGGNRSDYAQFPFRVLMVLPSVARRENLAERLLAINPPIETQVWMTTREEITSKPLGSVWLRPADYRTTADSVRARHPREQVAQRALFE